MATKELVRDGSAAPNTGAYSPALKIGAWIFVSGQGPISSDGAILAGDIEAQTRQTMENIKRLVESAGGHMDQVVKCTCYLSDISTFEHFDRVYRSYFSEPLPCRTTVQAKLDGIAVEIDAIAYLGD